MQAGAVLAGLEEQLASAVAALCEIGRVLDDRTPSVHGSFVKEQGSGLLQQQARHPMQDLMKEVVLAGMPFITNTAVGCLHADKCLTAIAPGLHVIGCSDIRMYMHRNFDNCASGPPRSPWIHSQA